MFKNFREFVSLKELAVSPMTPQTPTNAPANKNGVQDTLRKAMNVPPPTGTNPQQYRAKLQQAMQITKTGPVSTPNQAIDLVNVQQKASQ